jgi:hypothetical protein
MSGYVLFLIERTTRWGLSNVQYDVSRSSGPMVNGRMVLVTHPDQLSAWPSGSEPVPPDRTKPKQYMHGQIHFYG